jgi:hypothetical protein
MFVRQLDDQRNRIHVLFRNELIGNGNAKLVFDEGEDSDE